MAFFNTRTPVLNIYGSKPEGPTEWLLWPAFAFRALIPEPRSTTLNVFQRAALGLAAGGIRRVEDVAERLLLPPDLITFVVAELQARGALDRSGDLTDLGREILREAREPMSSTRVVYGFVDALSGRLWPRFHPGPLRYADNNPSRDKAALLVLGSPGFPLRIQARAVWPQAPVWRVPSGRALLAGYRIYARDALRHQRFRNREAERRGWSTFAEAEARAAADAPADRLTLVSEQPEAVFVPLQLYVPSDILLGTQWRARDPFGYGDSQYFRRAVHEARASSEGDVVRDVLGALVQEQLALGEDEVASMAYERAQAATQRVHAALGGCAVSDELAYGLRGMEEHAEAALNPAAGPAVVGSAEASRAMLVRVYGTLEQLFADAQDHHGTRPQLAMLSSDRRRNGKYLARLAQRIGFDTTVPPVLAGVRLAEGDENRGRTGKRPSLSTERFLGVTRDRCRNITEHGGQRLPEQAAVALLSARDDGTAPLAQLAASRPNALTVFLVLKSLRDAAAHGDKDPVPEAFAKLVREVVYNAARVMLPSSTPDGAVGADETGGVAAVDHTAALGVVLRQRARLVLDQEYGGLLDAYPAVREAALSHREAVLRLEALAGAAPRDGVLDREMGDLAVRAASLAQKAMELPFDVPPAHIPLPSPLPLRVNDLVQDAAEAAGLLSSGERVPDSVAYAKAVVIAQAFRQPSQSSLGALVAAAILCAAHAPDHPAARALEGAPRLVQEAGVLVDLRGHGGVTTYSPESAQDLKQIPLHFIAAALNIEDPTHV